MRLSANYNFKPRTAVCYGLDTSLVEKISSKLMKNVKTSSLLIFSPYIRLSLCTFKILKVLYKIMDNFSFQTYLC